METPTPLLHVGLLVELLREQLRNAEGNPWTQGDLAHAAGISVGTVQRLEAGTVDTKKENIAKVARALGLKPSALTRAGEMLDELQARPEWPLNPLTDDEEQRVAKLRAFAAEQEDEPHDGEH